MDASISYKIITFFFFFFFFLIFFFFFFCNVSTDNIIISKLIETKTNSKCLIRYLDNVIRRLVLILPKMGGYIKTFKVKDGNKDKNNKLMSFCMNDEQLLEKYKAF